jgi:hypothetical protein
MQDSVPGRDEWNRRPRSFSKFDGERVIFTRWVCGTMAIADLREIVLADLIRAQRLISRINDELDPQFRIATPQGDYWVAMTLSSKMEEREAQLRVLSTFMAWKLSTGFVLATELIEPDAVYAVGVTHWQCIGVLSRIGRQPLKFGPAEWLGSESVVGGELRDLLPKKSATITPATMRDLERYFGVRGKFPAVRIADGAVGL